MVDRISKQSNHAMKEFVECSLDDLHSRILPQCTAGRGIDATCDAVAGSAGWPILPPVATAKRHWLTIHRHHPSGAVSLKVAVVLVSLSIL